jgi:O-antigen/teichoic acid export membrane protein
VQSVTLLGNMLYGLMCVRLLEPSDYAKFVVLFGVQGMLTILMDANMAGTLIPLIGERTRDMQLIADYVASLRKIARRVYAIVGLGLIVCYPFLVKHRHWDTRLVVGMIVTLLISTWFARVIGIYGSVVIVLGDRNSWYRGQMVSSLGTLTLLGLAWATHTLSAIVAIEINVIGMIYCATDYYLRARTLLGVRGVVTSEKSKAILRLAMPNIPQAIFFAFQGQISLFLITYFGRANGIASVGALARLGQIFTLVIQTYPFLLEPYFAKLPKERLKSSYTYVLVLLAFVCVLAIVASVRFAGIFLWALGPAYHDLRYEVFLSMLSSATSCFSAALWTIHSARRFVYWWSTFLGIGLTLLVQIAFVTHADLTTVRTVLWLNISVNVVSLIVNLLCGLFGFTKGSREVENLDPLSPEQIVASTEIAALESAAPAIIVSTLSPVSHPE